ncbi:RagB/SusD family nutrient uptake outer membrane protein [Marinifilum sp.]|uniref:RagB/SusD family nutrient uptake outer membrane protein n=1 Tax=Marinifilum sp. TaxID=2033137 RepID=UPI003BAC1224
MNKIRIIYLFVFLIAFAACDRDELLDIAPYGKIIPETVEDFRLLLNERNDNITSYEIDCYLSDNVKVPDGTYTNYFTDNTSRYYDALMWNEQFGYDTEEDNEYLILYRHVLNNNVILQYIEDAVGSQAAKDKLISEAKVHRAFAYFSLVNLYSAQYEKSTAANTQGVPIRLSSEFSGASSRATVAEVYELILQDLNAAIDSKALETSLTNINWQPSEAAAYALLARVKLQMMNYPEALDAADKCLSIYNTLIDHNVMNPDTRNYENAEVILLKQKTSGCPALLETYASDDLIALYDASNDLRLSVRYQLEESLGDYFFDRVRDWKGSMNYIGPSVPEMYLIRAECYSRMNNGAEFQKAIDDLNTLRVTRYATGTYSNLTITQLPDAATTLAFVKEERRREMAYQGMRLFDIKRYLAEGEGDSINLVKTIEGIEYKPVNNNRLIVPIAKIIRENAPGIEQSPR